jgi:hypothetical protein
VGQSLFISHIAQGEGQGGLLSILLRTWHEYVKILRFECMFTNIVMLLLVLWIRIGFDGDPDPLF